MTPEAQAGEIRAFVWSSLPAAETMTRPWATAALAAAATGSLSQIPLNPARLPRLRLITSAGPLGRPGEAQWSMPAMVIDDSPAPWEFVALTPYGGPLGFLNSLQLSRGGHGVIGL